MSEETNISPAQHIANKGRPFSLVRAVSVLVYAGWQFSQAVTGTIGYLDDIVDAEIIWRSDKADLKNEMGAELNALIDMVEGMDAK